MCAVSPASVSELVTPEALPHLFPFVSFSYFGAFVGLWDLLSCFENKFVSIIQVKDS